ncbi:hypothetical protein RFI_06332 [Reticulomyxa filosa]|uniref:Uncharacterized protein n=1 Tax=Reticulomyxa filosa TaxID=46433 RepID=X6NY78_RETFI|nr:hypothetical protein RFI_06332 [Reticulomyxa filosa]|eukprot:ETO30789.1 hypothetical protein RFI_06332 [Reticulomyxa filosa]
MAPTKPPTKAPTYATPSILHCNYTVSQDRNSYTAKWSYPSGGDISALGAPDSYKIYQNHAYKGSYSSSPAVISSSNIVVGSTLVEVIAYWTRNSVTYSTPNKTCTGFTLTPTKVPTKPPTKPPTKRPTKRPTSNPTKSPTYQQLTTSHCIIEYISGQSKTALIYYTTPNYQPPQTVTADDTTFEVLQTFLSLSTN